MRASDAEREAVVERLRDASVEGRLTLAELTERTEAAYLAQTHAELAQITADLPAGAGGPAPLPVTPPAKGKARRWFVAVMGDTKRRGKWRIDQEIGVVCVMGDVVLDLREAEVRSNEVDIVATSVMGDVKIIVPDGVDVELSGMSIMGDKKVKVVEAPPGQNVPVVRVRGYAIMGDIKIIGDSRAEPIKRTWAAWSDWWLDRRRQADHELGNPAHNALRDAHTAWLQINRGSPPPQPPPPSPPPPPPPAPDPSRW
ncbi:hypothetical protein Aph01nite_51490 [Acrocarpospora phusangensis]|uniref:Cell wall-active antibiotics response LiaF-like C-terminal domain-containing protein n=2 Tax=Acrocarpospora phusangensis TaxID=1070424 RepID=A0A919UMC8_9ACTN|nr:hypothetical protein Aph01nite_51490 [Acrocarpospora phusangensis]